MANDLTIESSVDHSTVAEPLMAIAVANTFIEIGVRDERPVDPMKLLKLCFFAHGYHLALYHFPLLDEQVQAWQYGPVIPSIYHAFKTYGDQVITAKGADFDDQGHLVKPTVEKRASADYALIQRVWQTFGKFTGAQLSNMTHEPDTPWAEVWAKNPERLRYVVIPNKVIEKYFAKRLRMTRERVAGR